MSPQYLDRIQAFFDHKVQAFVRKTRGKQVGRVFFVKGVGDVPLSILHEKSGFWWEVAFFVHAL